LAKRDFLELELCTQLFGAKALRFFRSTSTMRSIDASPLAPLRFADDRVWLTGSAAMGQPILRGRPGGTAVGGRTTLEDLFERGGGVRLGEGLGECLGELANGGLEVLRHDG